MLGFILFIMFIIVLALTPYRKIYNSMNQLIDVKTLLISIAMMVFPLAWRVFSPETADAPAAHETGITDVTAGLTTAVGSFAEVLSWLIAFAGLMMIVFTVLTASDHQKKMNKTEKQESV